MLVSCWIVMMVYICVQRRDSSSQAWDRQHPTPILGKTSTHQQHPCWLRAPSGDQFMVLWHPTGNPDPCYYYHYYHQSAASSCSVCRTPTVCISSTVFLQHMLQYHHHRSAQFCSWCPNTSLAWSPQSVSHNQNSRTVGKIGTLLLQSDILEIKIWSSKSVFWQWQSFTICSNRIDSFHKQTLFSPKLLTVSYLLHKQIPTVLFCHLPPNLTILIQNPVFAKYCICCYLHNSNLWRL